MAITTATSASTASNNASVIKGEPASPASASTSNDIKPEAPVEGANPKVEGASTAPTTGANANGTQPPKRRAARRANTAERRATHNAVERMRRETLNGRFLTLASLLPPLAALRRPSKAAIVSSSIATVNAARRHRVLAAQTLRALAREAEGLRREVNEWRARARVPQLDVPVRSDAHQAVLRAELEDFDLALEEGLELEEGDEEDGDLVNENTNDTASNEAESPSPVSQQAPSPTASAPSPHEQSKRARSASTISTPGSSHGHPAGFFAPVPSAGAMLPPLPIPQTPIHARGAGRFAFDAPPASPSAASSASGGWDGPATPPASAGTMHPGMMLPQMLEQQHAAAMMGGKGFYDAPHSAGTGAGAGAAYDLGLGFDGEESLLLGGGGMGANGGMQMGMGWAHANPAHPAFHAAQAQQAAQQAIRLREVYEQQQQMLGMQMSAAGMAVPMQMQMQMGVPMGLGGMQMGVGMGGMQMGMGMPVGVAQGQYLHQPARFA